MKNLMLIALVGISLSVSGCTNTVEGVWDDATKIKNKVVNIMDGTESDSSYEFGR